MECVDVDVIDSAVLMAEKDDDIDYREYNGTDDMLYPPP
jgi:hypothetical protein